MNFESLDDDFDDGEILRDSGDLEWVGVVGRRGIEPRTLGLKARCSTN